MKAGIITFYYGNYNFGGQLQAYALCDAINDLGLECEQISFAYLNDYEGRKPQEEQSTHRSKIKAVKKFVKTALSKMYEPKIKLRIQAYIRFSNEIPHSIIYNSYGDLEHRGTNYDYYICGGDQIWNDWGFQIDAFTLLFAPEEKIKISYAASMGNANPTNIFLDKLERGICRLNDVAVREKSSCVTIERLTDRSVKTVLDPVFLLEREKWDLVLNKPSKKESVPYMFCYFLGTDYLARLSTTKYAHKQKAKVYALPFASNNTPMLCDLVFGDIRDFTSGPAEFVGLIKNAECVITDSFHAIVFSLIYHKPFYVFERNTQVGGGTMNSRIHDFLEEFGLQDRLVTPEQLEKKKAIEPIDYTYADKVLARRRKESFDYLRTALGIQNEV